MIEDSYQETKRIEKVRDYSTNPYILPLRRLLRNPAGIISLTIITIFIVVALLGANIRPDPSYDANEQIPQIDRKPPGFKATFLLVRKNKVIEKKNFFQLLLFGGQESPYMWIPIMPGSLTFSRNSVIVELYREEQNTEGEKMKLNVVDVVFPIDYSRPYSEHGDYASFYTLDGSFHTVRFADLYDIIRKEHIRERTYYLGTDVFGRDMLSRIMLGSAVSLTIGFLSVALSTIIGVLLGAIAGYFGGIIDEIILFILNVLWSVPSLLLAIAISLVLGKGMWQVFIALGITGWPEIARVVRGQTLTIKEMDYIRSARAIGLSPWQIIIIHIIPNCISTIVVYSAYGLATAIIAEAGLSFLGVGVQPPTPSWGRMIRDHYGYILTQDAHLAITPGIFLTVLVLAFTLLGYAVRDAFDIKGISSRVN